jgi:hypothetical protein
LTERFAAISNDGLIRRHREGELHEIPLPEGPLLPPR